MSSQSSSFLTTLNCSKTKKRAFLNYAKCPYLTIRMAKLSGSYYVGLQMQRTEDEEAMPESLPAGKKFDYYYRMLLRLPSTRKSAIETIEISLMRFEWHLLRILSFGVRFSASKITANDDSLVSATTTCQLAGFAEGVFRALTSFMPSSIGGHPSFPKLK